MKKIGIISLIWLLLLGHGQALMMPMVIKTTPRNQVYAITYRAPKKPKTSYLVFEMAMLTPRKVGLSNDLISNFGKLIDQTDEKAPKVENLTMLDLSKSSIVSAERVNFIAPADTVIKQRVKFKRPLSNNHMFLYTFDSVGKPALSQKETKDKVSAVINIKLRYIGFMRPAKPKPYAKFAVKEKNGRLYFRNKSKNYTAAYLACKENGKLDRTYTLFIPSNKQALNKRAMSWDLSAFIKQNNRQQQGNNKELKGKGKFSCQALYYKRLPSDKLLSRNKMLSL